MVGLHFQTDKIVSFKIFFTLTSHGTTVYKFRILAQPVAVGLA